MTPNKYNRSNIEDEIRSKELEILSINLKANICKGNISTYLIIVYLHLSLIFKEKSKRQ